MNIFFDVDYTLITGNYRLRPHVREVFARLTEEGYKVYLWSGMGKRWEVVEQFNLHAWVIDCFDKPLYNHIARLEELGVPMRPDFVVDDHKEIVDVFGGEVIAPAQTPLDGDVEMLRIYARIRETFPGVVPLAAAD